MDENEYGALRQQNIAQRNSVFAEFFADLKKQTSDLKSSVYRTRSENADETAEDIENQPPRKRRRTRSRDKENFRAKQRPTEYRKKYHTRSRAKKLASSDGGDDSSDSGNNEKSQNNHEKRRKMSNSKLRVLFPWAKPFQRSIDLMKMGVCDVDQTDEFPDNDSEEESDDSDDTGYRAAKKRVMRVARSQYDPDSIPSVDEITDDMLENIAEKSSGKVYSKEHGTSCHQCRQKTLDTKTVCRSGECIGVRGQFCGPCLRGRYGENALEALKDPNWACPPCRGLCNCSICRTRNGLAPTGILAPVVQEEGFASVMDYLQKAELEDT